MWNSRKMAGWGTQIVGALNSHGLPIPFILDGLGCRIEYKIANSERLAEDETLS